MLDLRELKLKNETRCECGHEFAVGDIFKLERNTDHQFYGGRIDFYTKTRCPECGKEVVLLLQAYNNSYKVIDVCELNESPCESNESSCKSNENACICEKCGNTFKSIQGLRKHQKKCLND